MAKITLFAQIIQKIPRDLIKSLIKQHDVDKHAKGFNSWSHLVSMVFCQFADCVSLREISNGLHSANSNLNHLGMRRAPGKSTLSYQNEKRSCEFFRDCYYALLNYFGQQVIFSGRKFRFKNAVHALDSSTITLCAEVYDWAHYTHSKGVVRLHTLLDIETMLPDFVYITDGKSGDNTAARNVQVKGGSIIVCDRGYFDTELFNVWDSKNVFFVCRVRDNMLYRRIEERDLPQKTHPEVLIDELVKLTGNETSVQYPKTIRRIAVYNTKHHYTIELVTNNMKLSAGECLSAAVDFVFNPVFRSPTSADIFRQRYSETPHAYEKMAARVLIFVFCFAPCGEAMCMVAEKDAGVLEITCRAFRNCKSA